MVHLLHPISKKAKRNANIVAIQNILISLINEHVFKNYLGLNILNKVSRAFCYVLSIQTIFFALLASHFVDLGIRKEIRPQQKQQNRINHVSERKSNERQTEMFDYIDGEKYFYKIPCTHN